MITSKEPATPTATAGGMRQASNDASMEDGAKKYQIVFSGALLPGHDPDRAKQAVRERFKNGDRLAGVISAGRALILKRHADYRTACRLKSIGEKCGLQLVIQPMVHGGAGRAQEKPPEPGPMSTCPWCGFWQPASQNCAQCGKPLPGTKPATGSPTAGNAAPRVADRAPKTSFSVKFRNFRVAVLLCILLSVCFFTWMNHRDITGWKKPLRVVVYPINGDGSRAIANFIDSLADDDFKVVERFFSEEAASYDIALSTPCIFYVAPEIRAQPPAPPSEHGRISVMWWSLKLRYWVFSSDSYEGKAPDIRVLMVYHDAVKNRMLADSLGIEKGHTAIVHAFADRKMADQNKIVLAHEILHTLGATDKYDLRTLKPDYPDGFADPDLSPLYPQTVAEIMGSRIPVSENRWEMPLSLDFALIGKKTAREIKWLKP